MQKVGFLFFFKHFDVLGALFFNTFLFESHRVKVVIDRVGRADIIAASTVSSRFSGVFGQRNVITFSPIWFPKVLFALEFGEYVMQEYFFISLVAIFALVLVGVLLALSTILGPKNPSPQKLIPYECGMIPKEEAKGRYPVRFATVAMLFIIFDIEVVFMYPWAVSLGQLKLFGLIEMLVFIFVLGIAYVYIWGRGGLEWD